MQQEKVRLQKILANQGYGSRRSIESLIKDRRICINGQIANLGDTVDSSSIITIDNEQIIIDWDNQQTVVLVLNKPVGVICSTKPQGERKTIFDLFTVYGHALPDHASPRLRRQVGERSLGRSTDADRQLHW